MAPRKIINKNDRQSKIEMWKEIVHCYEGMRYLWDKDDPNHKNKEMEQKAYETLCGIAKRFDKDSTPKEVKRKIIYMKNNYMLKYKQVQESLAKNKVLPVAPSLWYYDFFKFYGDTLEECVRPEENSSDSEDLSTMSTSEQSSALEFVRLIKKYPVLYNYKLPEYSRREPTDAAWISIANILNEQPIRCKRRWQNLRKSFVKNMKSGRSQRRWNYLREAMTFILPYIRHHANPQDLNQHESDEESLVFEEPDCNDFEDEACFIKAEAVYDATIQSNTECTNSPPKRAVMKRSSNPVSSPGAETVPSLGYSCIPASSSILNTSTPIPGSTPVPACVSIPISGSASLPASDSAACLKNSSAACADDSEPKRAKHSQDNESRKFFLLSVLPEVQRLSDNQMKFFRHKLLDILDEAESYSLFNGT